MEGAYEHGNEPSDYIKGRKLLVCLNDYNLLEKDRL
jgi:hypothetical protein